VADSCDLEALVICSRACAAASRDFVQRRAGPLLRPVGQCSSRASCCPADRRLGW